MDYLIEQREGRLTGQKHNMTLQNLTDMFRFFFFFLSFSVQNEADIAFKFILITFTD